MCGYIPHIFVVHQHTTLVVLVWDLVLVDVVMLPVILMCKQDAHQQYVVRNRVKVIVMQAVVIVTVYLIA